MLRCAFVEWPEGLEPDGAVWEGLCRQVAAARPDLLVANEMPFGPWLAARPAFDPVEAARSVALHERGLAALAALAAAQDIKAVVASRPVWDGARLANEAFALETGQVRPLHRKQYFPEEAGWHEATWFRGGDRDFSLHAVAGVKLGVLLCTELMFNERARHYGRAGAELIVAPRASGLAHDRWATAGAMAALVSGCYLVSANRSGGGQQDTPAFGGRGFAFAPDGTFLAQTSAESPVRVVALDPAAARAQQAHYPCYVRED